MKNPNFIEKKALAAKQLMILVGIGDKKSKRKGKESSYSTAALKRSGLLPRERRRRREEDEEKWSLWANQGLVGEEEVVRATWPWPPWKKGVTSECVRGGGEEFRPRVRVRAE